jgi:hypothetical protein
MDPLGRTPRRIILFLAIATMVALTVCDISVDNPRLGVLRDGDARIHVLYRGCAELDERVVRVRLVRVVDALGGDDDVVVWEATSESGQSDIDLVVGAATGPFHDSVELVGGHAGRYTVVVTTNLGEETAQVIEVEALPPNQVDAGTEGVMSLSAFDMEASQDCE